MKNLIIVLSLFLGFIAGWCANGIYVQKTTAKVSHDELNKHANSNVGVNEEVIEELPNESEIPESATYINGRYRFSIQYPAKLLFGQGESDNGDGQIFLSKDSKVELRVSGIYNVMETTIAQEYEEESRGGMPSAPKKVVAYKKLKDNWFVVSGYIDGNIFYQKRYLIDDHFVGLYITYPESQRHIWDKKVSDLVAAFNPNQR